MTHDDNSSWQHLKEQFLDLVSTRPPDAPGLWIDVWRLFVEHPWYQGELAVYVQNIVRRRGVPLEWADDVSQDTILLLARTLRHSPDLHVDRTQVHNSFPGWIGRIIERDCREALRRMASRNRWTIELNASHISAPDPLTVEDRVDLSMALDELDEPYRTIVILHSKGLSVEEISTKKNLTYWRTYRFLKDGLQQLKMRL